MVIMTAKLSRPKLIIIRSAASAVQETGGKKAVKLDTPESRVAFLSEAGYTVEETPVRTQEVRIPESFSEVYEAYNDIQKAQGFDLSKYRDKTVLQVVYQVTDYPVTGDEPVLVTLLIYKNKLIGADLSRGGPEGFLRPLLET